MSTNVTQLKVPFNEDNERLSKFIDLYIEYDGNHQLAWTDAGYSESTRNKAMHTLRKHWDIVQKRIVEKIGTQVPKALAMVVHLMENGKNESIRLKAAQDILGRAGYDQASKIELTDKKAEDLTRDELTKELQELMNRAQETVDGAA
jgi:hypothetical protein